VESLEEFLKKWDAGEIQDEEASKASGRVFACGHPMPSVIPEDLSSLLCPVCCCGGDNCACALASYQDAFQKEKSEENSEDELFDSRVYPPPYRVYHSPLAEGGNWQICNGGSEYSSVKDLKLLQQRTSEHVSALEYAVYDGDGDHAVSFKAGVVMESGTEEAPPQEFCLIP